MNQPMNPPMPMPCPVGTFPGRGGCQQCSNGPQHASYTSAGVASGPRDPPPNCNWKCDPDYMEVQDDCLPRIERICDIGYYKDTLGNCRPCTNAPPNSHYTSSGTFATESCSWQRDSAVDTAGVAAAAVLGGVLLVSLAAALWLLRAAGRDDPVGPDRCCTCLTTHRARRRLQSASLFLAALILSLSVIADALTPSCRVAAALGLTGVAAGLLFLGGTAVFALSSCGCALCCVCGGPCCGKAPRAAAAIAFAVTFLVAAAILYVYCLFVLALGAAQSSESLRCREVPELLPGGLLSWAGVLGAAAVALQGHFATLVPEAVAERAGAGGFAAAGPADSTVVTIPYAVIQPNQMAPPAGGPPPPAAPGAHWDPPVAVPMPADGGLYPAVGGYAAGGAYPAPGVYAAGGAGAGQARLSSPRACVPEYPSAGPGESE